MRTSIRTLCFTAVFVASAFQGITPDQANLASARGLLLLHALGGDSTPVSEPDDSSGQICERVECSMNTNTLATERAAAPLWFVPFVLRARTKANHSRHFASLPGAVVYDDGTIDWLCHFLC